MLDSPSGAANPLDSDDFKEYGDIVEIPVGSWNEVVVLKSKEVDAESFDVIGAMGVNGTIRIDQNGRIEASIF
jgi:hypothetical protein